MRRLLRIVVIVLVVLVVLGFGAARYLLSRTPVPETSSYALDMAEIRRLASLLPGEKPIRVNHEQVAVASLPRGAVFAGESLRTPLPMSHGAYQVLFPNSFGVIDSAFDEETFHAISSDGSYSPEAYAVVQRALGSSRFDVITHEHGDHVGGISRFPDPKRLVGRAVLTAEQLGNTKELAKSQFPEELRAALSPLHYDSYQAIAPGVVLVKAPGHTPGAQMVYVQLANGKELLFLGDVAWHMDQIRQLWYRPRLVTDMFIGEDRDAVLAQFRTLHELNESEPNVQLIPSHDVTRRKELIDAGVLGEHFEFPPAPSPPQG